VKKKEEEEEEEAAAHVFLSLILPFFIFLIMKIHTWLFFLFLNENYTLGMPNHLSDLPPGL